MKVLFWLSSCLILIAYGGYPLFAYLRARLRPCPVRRASIFPTVTILLAVRNEEKNLPAKLRNLASLDYPQDLIEIIVISDGSSDKTNEILASWKSPNVHPCFLPEQRGKASALNSGLAVALGQIVCFTDARQMIDSDGLKNLVANFADPSVGCVSGELMMGENSNSTVAGGVGLYWRLEKCIRNWEGLAASTVGATGAFYAVRRNLLSPLPAETILDDVYIPFEVVRHGKRVVFEPRAQAYDPLSPGPTQEFFRKVRTLAGNYQLLQLAPWVLTSRNPLRIQFVCHKLLRLLMPFALAAVLVSTLWLRSGLYAVALALQLAFYALAPLTLFRAHSDLVRRVSNIPFAFVILNAAAAVALFYFVTGRKPAWAA